MKIGGYQIIDLENRNLTPDVGMQYKGLYEKIEGTRKPILVSGLQYNNIEVKDFFCSFTPDGDSFVAVVASGTSGGIILVISDLDVVRVSVLG